MGIHPTELPSLALKYRIYIYKNFPLLFASPWRCYQLRVTEIFTLNTHIMDFINSIASCWECKGTRLSMVTQFSLLWVYHSMKSVCLDILRFSVRSLKTEAGIKFGIPQLSWLVLPTRRYHNFGHIICQKMWPNCSLLGRYFDGDY